MQVNMRAAGLILILILAATAFPAAWSQVDARTGERVTLEGQLSEIAFVTGGQVDVTATSSDDIYAAGGDLRFRGASGPGLHAVGGTLRLDDVAFENATLGGGRIELASGRTADDLIIGGGEVDVRPAHSVGGTALITGGRVSIEGAIDRDLWSAGGDIRLDASVGGSVDIEGDRVVIGPKTRIAGALRHRARSIEISPQAVITGGVTVLEPRERDWWDGGFQPAGFLVGILMLLALSWGAMLLLPGLMRDTDVRIRQHPGISLGLGVLIGIAAPVGFVVMMVTVVGIPIAFVTLMLLLASLPLAVASVAHTGGILLSAIMSKQQPSPVARFGWTAAAVLALSAIGVVPWFGGLAMLLVYALGLGAVAWCIAIALARGSKTPPQTGAPAAA